MKTRKEAEARSMELFPSSMNLDRIMEISAYRKAFLQCWEEMQQNKQTCGFCVEPISLDHNNIPESVYNGNIKESDAKQPNQDEFPCVDCLTPAECGDCEQCLNELFKKPTIHNIFEQPQVKEQPKGMVKVEKDHWMNTHGKQKKRCEAGCKKFYGGETLHHKDCVFYPESITKQYDQIREAAENFVTTHNSRELFTNWAKWSKEMVSKFEELEKALK